MNFWPRDSISLRIFTLVFGVFLSASVPAIAQQGGDGTADYIGSQACADCHTQAYAAWQGSHHAKAWRLAGPDTLVGAFEGEMFSANGLQAKFTKDTDGLTVTVQESDATTTVYKVHSVGGVHPLEHLILETGDGFLQSFDIVWDVEQRRWYHLYPDQDLPPVDAFHWSGAYKNWNARCAECHATGFEKNYDFRNRSYASRQVEIGVGCEACHGPGSAHVAIANKTTADPTVSGPEFWGFAEVLSNPEGQMAQCAGCHARREAFGDGNPVPGVAFADSYNLAMLRPELYHADGQILDEVYVYGSFLQSKMHQKGVTCANCHTPHAADTVADGNAVCTQCHSEAGNPDFPSLPLADYDTEAHTRHSQNSDAAMCVNCHMTDKVYMGIDARRDHSFRVPRPDLSDVLGAPNACTTCHTDQAATWAADKIQEWFPDGQWQQPHYGEVLAKGRRSPTSAAPLLLGLAQDLDQPDIVRATALWLLRDGAISLEVSDLGAFMNDADPQVRVAALSALRQRASVISEPYLIRGLNDDTRAVRIAAARAILSQQPGRMSEGLRAQVGKAYAELGGVLRNQMDFAEAHLQVGGFSMVAGNVPAAISALSEAVRINPQTPQAWHSLIRMVAQAQGLEAAQELMQQALKSNPNDISLLSLAAEF
ncbi:cytochrome c nitrite reductase pentaheme subunit [Shimia sp. SK013]|uniref:multiheme c-type cytochrome n=1 Tax=Shimia sp. SK013 TaxID=1389006 RepID=UPI0006B4A3A8|nr:multiheme c-type cytochrome [Shimia sp. SK013]KPA21554.1 cytochrome c nitrite reductase pentaheme subunit [Shimia sp. SK013]